MNLVFLGIVGALVAGTALWLASALWRGHRSDSGTEHHAVNAAVLRDQLAELEGDVANGTLSKSDFAAAKQELQQRVLHEASPGGAPFASARSSKGIAGAMLIVLPVATLMLYSYLGNPGATVGSSSAAPTSMTQADIQNMVTSLEARLADNPDDPEGWLMLARSYRYLEKFQDAAKAYANALPIIQMDASALTEYAETVARSSEAGFTGQAIQLLQRALTLDPHEPYALTLAGTAAFQHGDNEAAIAYWQQLLGQLPAGSEAAQTVMNGIEQAQHRSAAQGVLPQ